MNKASTATKAIAVIFLLLLGYFSFDNMKLLRDPVKKLRDEDYKLSEFVAEVSDVYKKELNQREDFITMNGYYARFSGARVSNDIILLKNGMLTEVQESVDTDHAAKALKELQSYLTETCDIPFVFVEMPGKPDLENKLVPTGVVNRSHEDADRLLEMLDENGVTYLDLRPYICADEEQMNQYFYKTDHHWNAEGAFVGFQKITEYLQRLFPEENIVGHNTNRSNWELYRRENYFLGSHGRRVGIGFAGVEDLIWLEPKFETEFSCAVPDKQIFRKGDFAESTLASYFRTAEPNYYDSNPYAIHSGGDYPHVQFRNANAPSSKKVLLIKESFGLPIEGFMATVFREIETLDLRYLEQYTAVEIIEQFKPDVVMVLYNPSFAGDRSVYNFGLNMHTTESMSKILIDHQTMDIPASEDATHKHWYMYRGLENGKTYTLKLEDITQTGKETGFIVATMYDPVVNRRYEYYMPDLAYIRQTGGEYRWIFNTPVSTEGELDLLIYTAYPGETNGVGAVFEGVSLYEGALYE